MVMIPDNAHVKRGIEVALVGDHSVMLIYDLLCEDIADAFIELYPQFQKVQSCECGYKGSELPCTCETTPKYPKADIYLDVKRPFWERIHYNRSDDDVLKRVELAKQVKVKDDLDSDVKRLLKSAWNQMYLTWSEYLSVVSVSKSIAALMGETEIKTVHIAEALQYRVER